jgi:hypothetical protein
MKYVWIIRTWGSVDSFWEHVREHKDYDTAFTKPEQVLEAVKKIILQEKTNYEENKRTEKDFVVEIPTVEKIQTRPFLKFLTISTKDSTEECVQNWYIERIKLIE